MSVEADSDHDAAKFVAVLTVDDLDEAELYQSLLEEHEIPAVVQEDYTETDDDPAHLGQVAVMVPEDHLAEAQDIIEQELDRQEQFDIDHEADDHEPDEFEGLDEIDPDFNPLSDL